MKIPKRLAELLQKDHALNSAVLGSLSTSETLLSHSRLPFFPDYTDHGAEHLQSTLITSEALITEEAWPILSPADAAMLVLSVLLHDLGMHLTEVGFVALTSSAAAPICASLDTNSWQKAWEDFFAEAKRFDGRVLKKLFGTAVPVQRPPSNPDEYTKNDRRLIGEFIRRNHPRLAHEIALAGVPGIPNYLLIVGPTLGSEFQNLAGLIARSHGVSVRAVMPELKSSFHLRDFRGVHAVYLMSVLRIADYLQIQAERAPKELLKISGVKSPLSLGEWTTHNAVRNITVEGDDPEAVEVQASPSDVKTYLRLKDIFAGLQNELDLSWAVLGEVYGRHASLAALGLEIRRVRSNLDDQTAFAKTVDYVPERAAFEAADADLLGLLVEPLYGDDRTLGVRELIQNSVDACRELSDYCVHTSIPRPYHDDAPDVLVSISVRSDGVRILTISDRGIGMTSEVVRDFFLKAGASFRSSEVWRKRHQTNDGRSRVLRSGRFGIGVLAAFLLGDRIRVTTRHLSVPESSGLIFFAEIDSEAVELRKCVAPIGTSIEIEIDEETFEWFESRGPSYYQERFGSIPNSLYLLESPSVQYRLPETRPEHEIWPAEGSTLPMKWRRLKASGFSDIHWTYERGTYGHPIDRLACNGIAVGESLLSDPSEWAKIKGLRSPTVSVFDPDANLPLTLTRTELAATVPFLPELVDDICRDLIAYFLIDPIPDSWFDKTRKGDFAQVYCRHLGVDLSLSYLTMNDGFSFPDTSIVSQAGLRSVVFISEGIRGVGIPQPQTGLLVSRSLRGLGECDRMVRSIVNPPTYGSYFDNLVTRVTESAYLTVSGQLARRWPNSEISKTTMTKLADAGLQDSLVNFKTKGWAGQPLSFDVPEADVWMVAQCALSSSKVSQIVPSPLANSLQQYLGTTIIPYRLDERRQRFSQAFKDLHSYVARHEQTRSDRK